MLLHAAVQATSVQPRRNCSEYEPRELSADKRDAIMASPGFTDFLARIRPRCKNPSDSNVVSRQFVSLAYPMQ